MAIANFIPQIWSARLLENLDNALVIAGLANTRWEGEIRDVGDRVRIQRPNNVAVRDYPAVGPIVYDDPTSTTRTLIVDQDRYWAITFDDLDRVQANIDLVNEYTQRAAYAVADDMDSFLALSYLNAGITLPMASGDNFYTVAVEAGQRLDENNVPRAGRWLLVTPAGHAKLLGTDLFTQASDLGDQTVVSGTIGRIAGFDVLMSNNVVIVPGTPDIAQYMFGTRDAITFARQLLGQPEALRSEDRFEDRVRGRMAYGSLVVEPQALGVIEADET